MQLHQLKMFCTIAKRGSLIQTAKDLKLTPSAISHGLKALETEMGCRLLDRLGKRVFLNQAGEQFLSQILSPIAALDRAGEELKKLGKWGQTRLRIGVAASACQYILPPIISKLKEDHPTISMRIETGDIEEMVALMRHNQIDLAIGVIPENKEGLQIRPIFKDEMFLAFSPSHPWANVRTIPRAEIPTQPFILYQKSSITSQMVDDYFRLEKMQPLTIMEIASIEAIKELVKLNLGVGIIAAWVAERELKQGSLRMRPMGTEPLTRQWAIVSMAGRRLNLVEETFCQICKDHVATLKTRRKDLTP